jgi:hypothetical protein
MAGPEKNQKTNQKQQAALLGHAVCVMQPTRQQSLVVRGRHYLLCAWLGCQGCGVGQHQINDLADDLRGNSSAQATLQQLEALVPPQRNRALYLLSKGQLKLLNGDFSGSISALEAAKQHLNSLQALSVSETLGASTINETLRSYTSTPGERILLQELLALNYLMLGRPGAARVEILQADVLMGQFAEKNASVGQVASTRYLGGLIFEMHREWDDALISYRKAAEILDRRGLALPPALQQSLLQLSARNGLAAEHDSYRQRFGFDTPPVPPLQGEIVLLYWQGQVSKIRQRIISVYAPDLKQQISLAMPYYPSRAIVPLRASITVADQQRTTAVIENVDQLARDDLDARLPAIMAAGLARVVVKQQAVSAAQKDSPQLGAILNLTTLLSEIADLRSWNMLASSIQVARISAPQGDSELTINTGVWQDTVPLRIANNKPCLVLALDTSRQVFGQACRPDNHQTGTL